MEANARRQGCRGAIHRARSSPYCTLDDLHKLLSRAVAARPLASSTAGRGEKSGLPRRDKSGVGRQDAETRGAPAHLRIGPDGFERTSARGNQCTTSTGSSRFLLRRAPLLWTSVARRVSFARWGGPRSTFGPRRFPLPNTFAIDSSSWWSGDWTAFSNASITVSSHLFFACNSSSTRSRSTLRFRFGTILLPYRPVWFPSYGAVRTAERN